MTVYEFYINNFRFHRDSSRSSFYHLIFEEKKISFEPVRDKTNNLGFRPGPTHTDFYSYRSRLET